VGEVEEGVVEVSWILVRGRILLTKEKK
jgi:hypothetical protein